MYNKKMIPPNFPSFFYSMPEGGLDFCWPTVFLVERQGCAFPPRPRWMPTVRGLPTAYATTQKTVRLYFLHFFSRGGLHTPSTPIYFAPGNQRHGLSLRGAVVCWSTAPNPSNHAARRMTDSPMFYRLTPMLPRCAGRMLLKPENTAAKQMSDKCQTNNLAQKGLSA